MRYFVAAWESLDPKAQTLNNLTARLLIEETRNQQSGSSKQDEALLHRQARTKPKDTQRSFQDAKTYTPFTSDHPIYLGDNSTLLAEGMGDIEIQAYVDGGCYNTYIRNVLYSPQLKKNLYSLSMSTRRGFNVIIKHDKLQIFMDNDLKAVGVRHDDLYRMLFKVTSSSQGYITSENKLQLWHERLAHLPVATLREMATKGLVDGLQPQDLEGEFFFCEGCQLGKAHRKSCYPSDGKNYQLGEFIYADICGPMQTPSLSKYLYFCLFKDYFSGYRHIYFIENKSDVLDIFKEYATLIYTQTGNKIKVLRTDNALEFKSDNFADLCKRFGIIHEFTAPYVHEQIGRIERDNRTIVEAARSMLNSRNLPGFFWAEACNIANYILNRSATKQTPGTTPYELFFGTKPNVANYKIFGCNAYMHIPKENRKKWDNKSIKLMFLGYENTSKNFRLWDWKTRKIRISKDVTFNEKATTHSDRESTKPKEILFQINSAPDESPVATANIPVQEMPPVSDISSHPMITRSKVSNSQCNFALADEPSNYIDAITSSDSERWKLAMDEEIDALNKNKTRTLERLADGHKPIGCKWVYKIKTESDGTIQRFKARLVAKGYSQIKMLTISIRLAQLKTCSDHLREAGCEVKDEDLAYSMLAGLPDSYDGIIMNFGNMTDDEFTSSKHYQRKVSKSDNFLAALNLTSDEDSWLLDSGATNHVCRNKDWFVDLREVSSDPIMTASGTTEAKGYGHIFIQTSIHNESIEIKLNNVLYVPNVRRNLLSVSKIEENGNRVTFRNMVARVFNPENRIIEEATNANGLYIVKGKTLNSSKTAFNSERYHFQNNSLRTWHQRLCHIDSNAIEKMAREELHRLDKMSKTIWLLTSDGKKIDVDIEIASKSGYITEMLEIFDPEKELIAVPQVDSKMLGFILEWIVHHKDDPPFQKDVVRLPHAQEIFSEWDTQFLEKAVEILVEMYYISNQLVIPALEDLIARKLSDVVGAESILEKMEKEVQP
ncbi:hypothetical protein LAZ67_10000129, partial [Cordylochernes scorpioides]